MAQLQLTSTGNQLLAGRRKREEEEEEREGKGEGERKCFGGR